MPYDGMTRKFHIALQGRRRGKKSRKRFGQASGDGKPLEQKKRWEGRHT